MADRLSIYNGALRHLGSERLVSLAETTSSRLRLDDVWEPAVNHMLEQGLWNFAIRSVELSNDENVEPLFGFTYAFSEPDDYVRLVGIADEPTHSNGFERYGTEAGYWYADVEPLYVRYVSNDASYGWNIARWREAFVKALEAYMAFESGLAIANDRGSRSDLFGLHNRLLSRAKTLDAVDERVKRRPPGRLVRSRRSRVTSRGRC